MDTKRRIRFLNFGKKEHLRKAKKRIKKRKNADDSSSLTLKFRSLRFHIFQTKTGSGFNDPQIEPQ